MRYFDGLDIGVHNHLPQCRAWIDRRIPYYALNYAHSGRIWWGMNGANLQVLSAPVSWWTAPGIRYVYGNFQGETWDHYYVTFSGPRVRQFITGGLLNVATQTPHFRCIAQATRFRTAMESLQAHLDRGAAGNARAVQTLEELLLQLSEQESAQEPSSALEREVTALMEQIRAEPHALWSAAAMAQSSAVSEVHLRRVFKQVCGLAPNQFIMKSRLDAAAHLLRTTSHPIKVIATRSGIEDVYYFSKLFKRQYGFSPAAYRRESQLL
jgi:AraC-like DNA-binding protein